jgi:hypothetical protein
MDPRILPLALVIRGVHKLPAAAAGVVASVAGSGGGVAARIGEGAEDLTLLQVRFVAAKPMRRGYPSFIAATGRLLAAALLDDAAPNAYFALLSQQCVLIQSFPRIYGALFPPEYGRSSGGGGILDRKIQP